MARTPKGWWDDRSKRYKARLGPRSESTGKPTEVVLTDATGHPLPYGDTRGVAAAIQRILAARAKRRQEGPTVAEVAAAFVLWHAEQGSAVRTIKDHRYHLNRFCSFRHGGVSYGDRAATSIEPDDLWRVKRAGLGALRLLYASVLACWNWASRPIEGRTPARLLPSNPLEGTQKPPRGRKTTKLVAWATTRRLLRVARAWARTPNPTDRRWAKRTRAQHRLKVLCLDLIASTGCRPFEAWCLRWDEIRWDEGVIVIDPRRTKPRGRDRRIALPHGLARALRVVERWSGRHPLYVFVPVWSRYGGEPQTRELFRWVREELRPLAERAQIPIPPKLTLYYLRHTWQTTGLSVASVEAVASAAGNSPTVLLDTYAHLLNEEIIATAGDVARKRRRAKGKGD